MPQKERLPTPTFSRCMLGHSPSPSARPHGRSTLLDFRVFFWSLVFFGSHEMTTASKVPPCLKMSGFHPPNDAIQPLCYLGVSLGVQNLQQPSPLPLKQETTRVVFVSPSAGAKLQKGRPVEFHSDEMFDAVLQQSSSRLPTTNHSITNVRSGGHSADENKDWNLPQPSSTSPLQ